MATFCIPNAPGVPGLGGQPPYWLPAGPYAQRTELDDPRWRGAYRRNVNNDVVLRAVYDEESGQKSLYVSWNAVFVPELNDAQDQLFLGLRPGAGGTAVVMRIQAHGTPSSQTAANVHSIEVFSNAGGPSTWASVAEPTWIDANARMWMTQSAGTTGSFAVQIRVPITASGGITNNAGPQIGDDPRIWFYVVAGGGVGPIELLESPDLGTTILNLNDAEFPDPAGWDRLSTISGDAMCPTEGGLAISSVDVGTTNTPTSDIGFTPGGGGPTNTFFARPRNYSGSTINAGDISARFRIANWGSIADPAASWVDIPGGGGVVSSANIPAIPAGSSPPGSNPISFNWQLSAGDIATFITGATTHKCILVELDGPNLTFFNESVYRNMDFVEASEFRREAAIDIRGLAQIGSNPRRDVYLAVEKVNMPGSVGSGPKPEDVVQIPAEPKPRGDDSSPDQTVELSRKEALALAARGQLSEEVIQSFMPTYRVHVYYDTGRRFNGQPVLRPQTSYGYFVNHEGPLFGWEDQIQAPADAQLEQINEHLYRISVPHNGVTTVTNVISAKEEQDQKPGSGCLGALFGF